MVSGQFDGSGGDAAVPGAQSSRTPRRRPKDRKQQIILQARDLFVERGYPNVSMAVIAERVDITAGALYRHFENKQVLLESVIDDSFAYLEQTVTSTSLEDAVDEAIERVDGHPYGADLWSSEARYLPDDARDDLRRRMRAWAHSFVPALRREQPGLDPWQEELVAWGLQSALACLGSVATNVPSAARRSAVRSAAVSLARTSLRPGGATTTPDAPVLRPISTRERLLLSAIEHFAERGYEETSMSSIGAAADVTGPNLYGYFSSKADLLRAVFERGMHALWLNLDKSLHDAATVPEALENLVAGHVRISQTWAQLRTDLTSEPDFAELARAAQREYVAEWVALVRTLDPEVEPREAGLRVLIALKIINDLHRTPHLSSYENFSANLSSLALATLRTAQPSPLAMTTRTQRSHP